MSARVVSLDNYRTIRLFQDASALLGRARQLHSEFRALAASAPLRPRAESALFLSQKLNMRTRDHNVAAPGVR